MARRASTAAVYRAMICQSCLQLTIWFIIDHTEPRTMDKTSCKGKCLSSHNTRSYARQIQGFLQVTRFSGFGPLVGASQKWRRTSYTRCGKVSAELHRGAVAHKPTPAARRSWRSAARTGLRQTGIRGDNFPERLSTGLYQPLLAVQTQPVGEATLASCKTHADVFVALHRKQDGGFAPI